MSDEREEKEQANAAALARALEPDDAQEVRANAAADDAIDREEIAELAELAQSLRAAEIPGELAKEDHDAIISKVLSSRAATAPVKKSGGRVIRVAFGVTATLALAAAILLYIVRPKPQEIQVAAFARSRSTTPLFSEPFKAGSGTARIDRIASSRERDYRENLFAMRGVR